MKSRFSTVRLVRNPIRKGSDVVRWLTATLVLSSFAGCMNRDMRERQEVLFAGRCVVHHAGGPVSSTYRMMKDEEQSTISLVVDAPIATTVWSTEIGQTKPTAAYGKYIPGVGHSLVIEAAEGASMLRLVLITFSITGEPRTVFDETSRFGFDMLNVDSDPGVEVIATSGDLAGPKTIRVFAWDGEVFAERDRIRSSGLPQYQVVTDP